jgi:DNA-binding NtrC family response regulator
LSVILIHVPTLNERLDDIPILANHFIKQICDEYGMPEKTISDKGIKELQKINWTGNIREFRNVIERLIILCDRKITDADVLQFAAPLK